MHLLFKILQVAAHFLEGFGSFFKGFFHLLWIAAFAFFHLLGGFFNLLGQFFHLILLSVILFLCVKFLLELGGLVQVAFLDGLVNLLLQFFHFFLALFGGFFHLVGQIFEVFGDLFGFGLGKFSFFELFR